MSAGNAASAGSGRRAVSRPKVTRLPPVTRGEIAEKIKELVRLAQEQGYLTYNDINDALPDQLVFAGGSGRDLRQVAQPGN